MTNSEFLRHGTNNGRAADQNNYSDTAIASLSFNDETIRTPQAHADGNYPRLLEMAPVERTERGDEGLPSFGRLIMIAIMIFAVVGLLIMFTLP